MPVSQFQRQMGYLWEQGYQCLPLQTLMAPLLLARHHRRKLFVLTFDDGYEDFLSYAYPVLRDYGFTATMFLVTDYVGQQSQWEGATDTPLLSWEQADRLHDGHISFGSHTSTHPRLLRLSQLEIWHELTTSRQRLHTELGLEEPWLAYPFGESNKAIQEMAEEAGYQGACGVATGHHGPYNLWRRPCRAYDSLPVFAYRISLGSFYLNRLERWFGHETAVGRLLRRAKRRLIALSRAPG